MIRLILPILLRDFWVANSIYSTSLYGESSPFWPSQSKKGTLTNLYPYHPS